MGLKLSNKEQKRSYFILTGTLKKKNFQERQTERPFFKDRVFKFREKIAGNW